jgi:hypothetical protein
MPVQLGAWVVIGALAAVVLWRMVGSWIKYRGNRLVSCPENQRPAGVRVAVGHAAATALGPRLELRLSSCSRWPEKAGCGQQCLSQVEASPEDCLVRNILAKWFEGKVCAVCGRPVGEIHEIGSEPALLRADKVTVEWKQVPVDQLLDTLAASEAICYACHMASTLVREHPELVVDRSRPIAAGKNH